MTDERFGGGLGLLSVAILCFIIPFFALFGIPLYFIGIYYIWRSKQKVLYKIFAIIVPILFVIGLNLFFST